MKEDKDWKEKVRELMEKIEDRKDSINISCDCGDGFESNDYYQAVSALEEAENDLFDFKLCFLVAVPFFLFILLLFLRVFFIYNSIYYSFLKYIIYYDNDL